MAYKVLSLKWRPQKFSQIEGQEPIKQVLTNAIQSDNLHPALIFSGTKGTGKTSTARIVAKSLKCTDRKEAEPCDKCASCISITDGRDMDVIEIDGASNNGVDAIRDLKNSVQYMPTQGSKRIYIIDEVHMLTGSAFNALLKTLEEPPEHITFIMATTELRKIPSTVLSRCQIFYFRPIPFIQIQKRLKEIAKVEKINIDEEALWLISDQAQNSLRDAQVLLDQMACIGGKKISVDQIIGVLALTPRTVINSTLQALVDRDLKNIVSLLPSLAAADCEDFLKQLLTQIRNLLMVKMGADTSSTPLVMESEEKFLKDLSSNISIEDLHFLFDMCLKGRSDLTRSFDPTITLEMLLLRMCDAPRLESIFEGDDSSNSSEKKSPSSQKSTSKTVLNTKAKAPVVNNEVSLEGDDSSNTSEKKSNSGQKSTSKTVLNTKAKAPVVNNEVSMGSWISFIKFIQQKEARLSAEIKSFSLLELSETSLVLGYAKSMMFLEEKIKDREFKNKFNKYVKDFFKKDLTIQFKVTGKESVREQEMKIKNMKDQKEVDKILAQPAAQKIQDLFQAQVVSESSFFKTNSSKQT